MLIPPLVAFMPNLAGPDAVMILMILMILLLGVVGVGFTLWMLIDCLTLEPKEGNDRLIWVLVILLAPFGSLIYFFARKLGRKPPALR